MQIPEGKILKYLKDIAKGLQCLHNNNVVHRNLNPAKVLIDDKGNAKITDFVVSKILKNIHSLVYKTVQSYGYMSPEVLRGEMYNSGADIWSLGCMAYQLCTFQVSVRRAVVALQRGRYPGTGEGCGEGKLRLRQGF